jgi:hypothetical protein
MHRIDLACDFRAPVITKFRKQSYIARGYATEEKKEIDPTEEKSSKPEL